ncbi:hypothetical protein [Massilia sp. H6]|uniref:hypothetical protein n=1 Tax=Massilia sp. H6 TaxID=2970464 RepID=UPI0021694908|nr:hypothetical protein [Massilia sp. H6]UVW30640.1 hypothetical protein NRS07_19365 [Massilia sp. H6]
MTKTLPPWMSPVSAVDDLDRPLDDVISRIEKLNEGLRRFWSEASGWAPEDAAALMTKSRLDWQVSLSRSLRHWDCDPPEDLEEGDLILAWTNLGSLIEGTIKLFLAVHYDSYKNDIETLKDTKAWHKTKKKLLDPDGLALDTLIDYIQKANLFPTEEIDLCKLVQSRRNAIHAFKDRPIDTGLELHMAIKKYLSMLRSTAQILPYPDDVYAPRET